MFETRQAPVFNIQKLIYLSLTCSWFSGFAQVPPLPVLRGSNNFGAAMCLEQPPVVRAVVHA